MNNIHIAFLLIISVFANARAQFGHRIMLEQNYRDITDIRLADLNNDGLKDIITSKNTAPDRISVYYNQGNGSFGAEHVIREGIYNPRSLATADVNSDGREDIITASYKMANQSDSLYVLINNAGNNFTPVVIDTQNNILHKIFKVATADADNDSDADIVTVSDTQLLVFYNDGNGNFTKHIVALDGSIEIYDLALADLEGDNFPEIIVGSVTVRIYKNTNGVFSLDGTCSGTICNTGIVTLVHTEDIDNDGDEDLIITGNNDSDLRL